MLGTFVSNFLLTGFVSKDQIAKIANKSWAIQSGMQLLSLLAGDTRLVGKFVIVSAQKASALRRSCTTQTLSSSIMSCWSS